MLLYAEKIKGNKNNFAKGEVNMFLKDTKENFSNDEQMIAKNRMNSTFGDGGGC